MHTASGMFGEAAKNTSGRVKEIATAIEMSERVLKERIGELLAVVI